jgi:hypothetical protein
VVLGLDIRPKALENILLVIGIFHSESFGLLFRLNLLALVIAEALMGVNIGFGEGARLMSASKILNNRMM